MDPKLELLETLRHTTFSKYKFAIKPQCVIPREVTTYFLV